MNILEVIARRALVRPEHPALILGTNTVTYAKLMAGVERVAAQLHARGIRAGDRVGVSSNMLVPNVTMTLAVAHVGAVSVPLSIDVRSEGNDSAIEQCGVKLVIHHGPTQAAVPAGTEVAPLESLVRAPAAKPPPMVRTAPHDLWRIGTSSGTTGRPKTIAFTHENILLKVNLVSTIYGASPDDRMLVCMGLNLSFSTNYWMRTLFNGGTVIQSTRSTPAAALETLHKSQATFLLTSPGVAMGMVNIASKPDSPYPKRPAHLKTVCIGGSDASPRLQSAIRQYLCENLNNVYGATETGMVAIARGQVGKRDPRCAGELLPWVECQAIADNGEVLPPGEAGLLRVRSPMLATGYVTEPSRPEGSSGGVFRDGWFYSADMGYVTQAGLLYLGGRETEVLNLSGLKVDPARIEEVIHSDPSILECAVVAVPGRLDQPALVAVVVAPDGFDLEALKKRCKDRLGAMFVPRAILKAPRLPRNEAGKVLRDQVRALVMARPEAKKVRGEQ